MQRRLLHHTRDPLLRHNTLEETTSGTPEGVSRKNEEPKSAIASLPPPFIPLYLSPRVGPKRGFMSSRGRNAQQKR